MAVLKGGVSRCGLCRFYNHEGRRGGICSRLDAPVAATWDACGLVESPFEQSKGAMANQRADKWLVPETAFELVANPTVVGSVGCTGLKQELRS